MLKFSFDWLKLSKCELQVALTLGNVRRNSLQRRPTWLVFGIKGSFSSQVPGKLHGAGCQAPQRLCAPHLPQIVDMTVAERCQVQNMFQGGLWFWHCQKHRRCCSNQLATLAIWSSYEKAMPRQMQWWSYWVAALMHWWEMCLIHTLNFDVKSQPCQDSDVRANSGPCTKRCVEVALEFVTIVTACDFQNMKIW